MAPCQLRCTVRLPFTRKGSLDTSRIRCAAVVLAVIYLDLYTAGSDRLSPFSCSASDREAYSNDSVKSRSLPLCISNQAKFWSAGIVGFQYAAAASPTRNESRATSSQAQQPFAVRYRSLMTNEIVANLAGVPVELLVKDLWDQVFHKRGRKYWLNLIFWLRGYFMYKDARKVAIMITRELQTYLYDEAPVNDSAWKTTRRLLEEHLREWWISCPEDPYRALTAGVWKSLVKVYADFLEPALRGSQKLKELEDVLFDPELKVIRSWTDAAHVNVARGKEDEIAQKLDNLARERPRDRKATPHEMALPISVGPVEPAPVLENEHGDEVGRKSRRRESHDKKTRKTVHKKRSTKVKEA